MLQDMTVFQASIYMTVRNGQGYVLDALASVRQQTVDDYEFVIVDDGSSDDTVRILEAEARADSRMRVISTGGVGRARALNMALHACSAQYVLNLDADDLAHPKRIEYLYVAMRDNPEYNLVSAKNIRFWDDNAPAWPEVDYGTSQLKRVNHSLLYGNPICHSGIIAKHSSLLAVGGYNESRRSQIDYDLWVRMAKNGASLGLIDLPLVAKRMNRSQSFAGQQPIRYALRGVRIRVWALRTLNAGWLAWANLAVRFIWAFIPLRARYHLRKMLLRSN
jgi:glycosyltransferase involved in cell wall biosynthesis